MLATGNALEACLAVNIEAGMHTIAEVDEELFADMAFDSCAGSFFHVYFSYRGATKGNEVEMYQDRSSADTTYAAYTADIMEQHTVVPDGSLMLPSCVDISEGYDNNLAMELCRELKRVSREDPSRRLDPGLYGDWPNFFVPRPSHESPDFKELRVYSSTSKRVESLESSVSTESIWLFDDVVRGISQSRVFCPIISWQGENGSVGGLLKLQPPVHDYADEVLLAFTVALELLLSSSNSKLMAIFGILTDNEDDMGPFGEFPFHRLQELSDEPSHATNTKASDLFANHGYKPSPDFASRSVRWIVAQVVGSQCIRMSTAVTRQAALTAASIRLVDLTNQLANEAYLRFENRSGTSISAFTFGRPQGEEVMDWLTAYGFQDLADVFIEEGVDSLFDLRKLYEQHQKSVLYGDATKFTLMEIMWRSNARQALQRVNPECDTEVPVRLLGSLALLSSALMDIQRDPRSSPLAERLYMYREPRQAGLFTLYFSSTGFEQGMTARPTLVVYTTIIVISFGVFALNVTVNNNEMMRFSYLIFVHVNTLATAAFGTCGFFIWFEKSISPLVLHKVLIFYLWLVVASSSVGVYLELSTRDPEEPIFSTEIFRPAQLLNLQFLIPYVVLLAIHRFKVKFTWIGLLAQNPLIYFGIFENIRHAIKGTWNMKPEDLIYEAWLVLFCDISTLIMWGILIVLALKYFAIFKVAQTKMQDDVTSYSRAWASTLAGEVDHTLAEQLVQAVKQVQQAKDVRRKKRRMVDHWRGIVSVDTLMMLFFADVWSLEARRYLQRAGSYYGTIADKERQHVYDVEQLFADAKELHWYFHDLVRGWGHGLCTHVPGPIKNPKRALAKVIRMYNRDASMLTDLVRCTMVCRSLPAVIKLFKLLVAKAGNVLDDSGEQPTGRQTAERKMIRITQVKNRFDPAYDAATKSKGYRDLKLSVEVGWIKHEKGLEFISVDEWDTRQGAKRHICEIQIHVERIFEETGRYTRAGRTAGVQNYQIYRDLMIR